MPSRDIISPTNFKQIIGPAVLSATTAGNAADSTDFDGIAHLISVGAGGITFDANNRIDFVMEHSSDGVTYNPVSQSDIQSYKNSVTVAAGGIVRTLNAAKVAADTDPTKVGYIGNLQYSRIRPVFVGTHGAGTPISIIAVRGASHFRPVA